MTWQQLRLVTNQPHAELVAEALQNLGALSITYLDNQDSPQFEANRGEVNLWPETNIMALFPAEFDMEIILAALRKQVPAETQPALQQAKYELLEDKDWQHEWKTYFKPLTFGDKIHICPSWYTPEADHRCTLMLDPGMAFGTGTHETTQLMLEWLAATPLEGSVVIDYGCGSGILAMAAAKLDAKTVVAIDNDPQAVTTTEQNARENHIPASLLSCYCTGEYPKDLQANIILANILANPLKQLASHLISLLTPNGYLVLSGLLANQAEELESVYQPHIEFISREIKGDWLRLVGKKIAQ